MTDLELQAAEELRVGIAQFILVNLKSNMVEHDSGMCRAWMNAMFNDENELELIKWIGKGYFSDDVIAQNNIDEFCEYLKLLLIPEGV